MQILLIRTGIIHAMTAITQRKKSWVGLKSLVLLTLSVFSLLDGNTVVILFPAENLDKVTALGACRFCFEHLKTMSNIVAPSSGYLIHIGGF